MNGTAREPSVVAAIDVGTNSIHMIVARGTGGGFDVTAREKNVVRLGSGGGEMTRLGQAAIERGVAALRHMRLVADAHGATVRAVATSAVREADNAEDFLARARAEAGIDIEVISGVEEARLIHLGAMQALPRTDDKVLLVDIGGGSTEVILSHRGHILFAQSLKMGAVRFTERFLPQEKVEPRSARDLSRHVASTIAVIAHEVRRIGFETAVVSSGTAESLTRMAAALRDDLPVSLNGCRMQRHDLDRVVESLLACETTARRAELPGIDSRRAEIVVAGALILQQIARSLDIEEMIYSEYALREGVLLDTLQRRDSPGPAALADAERDAVSRLAERCSVDLERSSHIAGMALALFRALSSLHGFDRDVEPLLEAAGMLWSTGLAVSHSRYQHHSYYIVRNADLMGYTDKQIEIIALICRYHRKGHPKPAHEGFGRLEDADKRLVTLLAGILRVAIALDRSHDQSVEISDVSADVAGGPQGIVRILVTSRSADEASELNLHTANVRSGLLAEAIGRRIELALAPEGDDNR